MLARAAVIGLNGVYVWGARMVRRSYLAAMLGLSLCCGHTAWASAQQRDGPGTFYSYARNKIGLLRYCRDQALVGQVTADGVIKAVEIGLRRLPSADRLAKERGDRAEKAGEAGFWEEANGKQDLASVAKLFGTTTAGLCKELAGQDRGVQQQPASPPAASTVAGASASAARSSGSIECEGNFQVQKDGNRIATPYCHDGHLALVAREYGARVSAEDIRQGYGEKRRACGIVGADNRVRDACSQFHPFKRARR